MRNSREAILKNILPPGFVKHIFHILKNCENEQKYSDFLYKMMTDLLPRACVKENRRRSGVGCTLWVSVDEHT